MNELLLQRCVHGELSASERATFLSGLGNDVDNWKQLACRLLEDRLLQAGCMEWLDAPAASSIPANRIVAGESDGMSSSNGLARGHSNGKLTKTASITAPQNGAGPRERSMTHRLRSLAMPVCAGVLGVVLGLWMGSRDPARLSKIADGGAAAGGSSRSPDVGGEELANVPEAPTFRTIRLTVNTPDGPRDVDVPVVGSDDLPLLTSMGSSISPEIREQLSRQGIELNEVPGVITLPIDDARSVAVPVRIGQVRHIGL